MKFVLIFLSLIAISCSQKYQTFNTIKKSEFVFGEEHSPISPRMTPGRKVIQKSCEGQFLFNRNAKKINLRSIPALIKYSCPKSEFLLNARITETWWTTVIYSKSCIELESFCPLSRK
jgi:hypothetical protein